MYYKLNNLAKFKTIAANFMRYMRIYFMDLILRVKNVFQAPPEEEEIDEMDDIDKVRDDLQSTKQLLALELRCLR